MKEVKALVVRYKNREERDRTRAQLARKVLGDVLAAASSGLGTQRWINEGKLERRSFSNVSTRGGSIRCSSNGRKKESCR